MRRSGPFVSNEAPGTTTPRALLAGGVEQIENARSAPTARALDTSLAPPFDHTTKRANVDLRASRFGWAGPVT